MQFIISVLRCILPFLTVIILTKCMLSLVLGHPKEKTYGYLIDLADGETYPLNMWETSIGRGGANDLTVGYNTVSRNHAVISRRIDGWYVYDISMKSATKVNGEDVEKNAVINNGDILTFGLMQYRFVVADDPVVKVGKKKSKLKRDSASFETQRQNQYNTADDSDYSLHSQYSNAQYSNTQYNSNQTYNQSQNPYNQSSFDSFNRSQNPYYEQGKRYADERSEANLFDGDDDVKIYTTKNKSQSSFENDEFSSSKPFSVNIETAPDSDFEPMHFSVPKPVISNKDTGESFILSGNFVTIGRARTCDIKLTSSAVSRHHANLVLYEDGWVIEDNSSTAGTYLNGEKVNSPMLLFDSDVIGLADERLYFTMKN